MKILTLADEVCADLWDYYTPGKLSQYDLILSSGDLKAEYLSFLVTMARCPLLYVHGNHDQDYAENPPEGCDCIDDKLMVDKGLRILGLGGCRRYSSGAHQYSEKQMEKRIRKLKRAIRLSGGVDIVLGHAAPYGVGDAEDLPHRGFEAFLRFIEAYHPAYFVHGHVHLNYGAKISRIGSYEGTTVLNTCGRYVLDWEQPPKAVPKVSRIRKRLVRNYEEMGM